MTFEYLISTMHQKDFSLIERMNINHNSIIVNQCDEYNFYLIERDGFYIKWFNVKERGLSRSRNIALSKATADICLLVDDDEVFYDNTPMVVLDSFKNNKKADVFVFNLESI